MPEESLKQQTKKGLYWQFFTQFANYGLSFVVSVILARLLSPEDYGITALPGIFVAVAFTLSDAGFGDAVLRKSDLKEEDLSTAFYYSLGVGAVLYLALVAASGWIADFYNAPILSKVLKFTAIGLIIGPLSSIQSVQLRRKLDFKTVSEFSIIASVVTGIVGIAMAYMGCGIWALVIPSVVSQCLKVVLYFFKVRWYPKTGWSRQSFKYLWGFGNKMMASRLLDTVYTNIYPVVIGKFISVRDLGIYNRAHGYASLPATNITQTLQRVTYPVLSKIQNDDDALARNYQRMLKVTVFIVFPIMMLLSALARPVVILLVTEKWESCIILLQIMCFSLMWYPVHAINLNLLMVKGRSDYFLKLEVIKKIYGVAILACTIPFGLIWLAIGGIASSMISLALNTHYTGKLINWGYWKQMKDYLPALILSFTMWGLVHLVNTFLTNLWAQLFIGGIVGVVFYLGISYLLKRPELDDIKYLLKIKK